MAEEKHSGAMTRKLVASEIPLEGLEIDLVASERERRALAELNGLPAIASLTASLRARRWRGDGVEIVGDLRARVRQTCVVTLEEFEADVSEAVDVRFAPPKEPAPRRSRRNESEPEPLEHDLTGEDPPDLLVAGAVDLGSVISEFFTLALDPYPRKPGAAFAEPAPAVDDDRLTPFAKLRGGGDDPAEGR
jgi:hypothetical protein